MSDWFSPIPYKYDEEQRLTLDFGLSAVTKHFNEQIVPKIGSVWRLRSISYALASFELHKKLKSKLNPSKIAHGIEALANKLCWVNPDKNTNKKNLGVNGFNKFPDDWSYKKIITHYVKSNTMRQSAVATIKNFGLVKGYRFNSFILEPAGKNIADAFIDLDKNDSLCKWLSGGSIDLDKKEIEFIRPERLSKMETALFLQHINSRDSNGAFPNRRKNLWELYKKNGEYHELTEKDHVHDIELTEALETLKITLQIYYKVLAQKLGHNISKINIDKRGVESAISNYKAKENLTTMTHPNIQSFLKNVESKNEQDFIRYLLSIENKLIYLDNSNTIQKGQMYDEVRLKALPDVVEEFELQKLAQIKQLISECN